MRAMYFVSTKNETCPPFRVNQCPAETSLLLNSKIILTLIHQAEKSRQFDYWASQSGDLFDITYRRKIQTGV